ncbi:MAG: hypothetical protein KDD66_08010 [Bdellovibrionales bacterium]|nr:hypothetical protein [Bdellovibrionales bacterium]
MTDGAAEFNSVRHRALRMMLRPLVRFWLHGGDALQSFIDSLKVVFVEVAVEEMAAKESRINLTRISLITGVHRPDVTRIVKESKPPDRSVADVVTRTIGQWENDQDFCGKDKKPRTLTYRSRDSEFNELVARVSKDVKPGSVLFALEQLGAVKQIGDRLKLTKFDHNVSADEEQSFDILSRDIQSLVNAVEENVRVKAEVSPNMHIRTECDNVFVHDLPKVRKWLWKEGKAFHRRARAFLAKHDKDINDRPDREAGAFVSVSAFGFICEKQPTQWSVGMPLKEVQPKR